MTPATLELFRQIAAMMAPDTVDSGPVCWVWERNGEKTYTTESRAKRYAAEVGGIAYPESK